MRTSAPGAASPISSVHLCAATIADTSASPSPVPGSPAVSLHSGIARIATDRAHSGTASLRGTEPDDGEAISILGIAGVDTLLEGTQPMIVKIDVEGHEETVIDALLASVHRDRIAAIFYEVDERWIDASAIVARLRRAGFARFTRFSIGRHYDMLAEMPKI